MFQIINHDLQDIYLRKTPKRPTQSQTVSPAITATTWICPLKNTGMRSPK